MTTQFYYNKHYSTEFISARAMNLTKSYSCHQLVICQIVTVQQRSHCLVCWPLVTAQSPASSVYSV